MQDDQVCHTNWIFLYFSFFIHTVSLPLWWVSFSFFCHTLFHPPVLFYFTPPPPPPPIHFSFSLLCYACFWRRVWPPAVLLTQHLLHHSFYPFTPSRIPSISSSLLLLSHSPFLFSAFNLYIQWISKPLSLRLFCSFFLSLPLSYLFSGICLSVVAQ